ncbi:EthD family reductase [Fredinandcohnia sp. 179-A 10B2 NHS]|uniref:EthD family reductase n=1 Tax=Fredinandcohnia sp. 179-A 10B2 NHS TaxID=3235176 RepID=UPI0039A300DE
MAKVIVMYDQPTDKEAFEKYYFEAHVPLAQKVPNLIGAEIHRVLQSINNEGDPYLFVELHFENPDTMSLALSSPEWEATAGDVQNLMPYLSKPPVISLVD